MIIIHNFIQIFHIFFVKVMILNILNSFTINQKKLTEKGLYLTNNLKLYLMEISGHVMTITIRMKMSMSMRLLCGTSHEG